jgi:hypothetical protein
VTDQRLHVHTEMAGRFPRIDASLHQPSGATVLFGARERAAEVLPRKPDQQERRSGVTR